MDVRSLKITADKRLREAIAVIDASGGSGIALVVGEDDRLIGVLTDGDIRRAILNQFDLDQPIERLLKAKEGVTGKVPLSLPMGASREEIRSALQRYHVRHIPLLDDFGRVVKVVTIDELLEPPASRVKAVIMAGGLGTRLRPLTEEVPKPMLPIAGKPILHRIVDLLRRHEITDIVLVVNYKKDIIKEYFGDGSDFGVNVTYITEHEDAPRGTAGAISHVPTDDRLLLVANGDLMTTVNLGLLEQFHRQSDADLTMAVATYDSTVPYGVVEMVNSKVARILEKPRTQLFVNAGMYMMRPEVCELIPHRGAYNMTDLIEELLNRKRIVVGFPVREYWRDIGQHQDYLKAEEELSDLEEPDMH